MFLYISNILCLIWCFFPTSILCLFEMCNHKIELKAGEKIFVNSPYYPAEYPIGSSCRYVINAPRDNKLKFSCNIKLNTPPAAIKCLNDAFYFNREGSEILTESEYFCGTGKMEKKSFLNQAVISYISTPYYKRLLTNVIQNADKDMQRNKTKKTKIKIKKQQQNTITTTKAPTTSKALKGNQLTTLTVTTKTTTPVAIVNNLLTSSFSKPFSSTTSLPTSSIIEENTKVKGNMNEIKKVSNSFAYVVTLLSNKIEKEASQKTTTRTTSLTTTTKSPTGITTTNSTSSRPTSVFNFYNFLLANSWRNGSIASHKISTQRVAKVVVGEDDISSHSTKTTSSTSTQNSRLSEGGGSFSCLVEVIESHCECGWSSTVKVVGASGLAGINEFPSMAGIMTIKNHKIFCGASIIHHRYLLSAAHCYITPETNTPEYLTAVVGEHDLSTVLDSLYTRQYDIIKIIPHEHFKVTSSKVDNDIALLKTRFSIEWNRSVGPVCLPFYSGKSGGGGTIPLAGQRVETAGWGTTSFGGQQSSLLLKTTLDVISNTQCQNILRILPFGSFCTYTSGRDTCQYDSGGALYARGEHLYAVGIVSYGYGCATNQPSVNTRISSHLKWIRNKTPEVKYCTK